MSAATTDAPLVIGSDGLGALLDACADGRTVHGPVERDGAVVVRPISSIDELPVDPSFDESYSGDRSAVVTTLVETSRLQPEEPVTEVVVETLSGLVTAVAQVEGTEVRSVTFRGVPSWVAVSGLEVEVDGQTIEVDLGFGGIWFALVRVEQTGVPIAVESVPNLVALSHRIRLEVNKVFGERTDWPSGTPDRVDQLLYVGPPRSPGADGQNLATSTGLGFDRSPCGTGSCARMAWHFARGELGVGDAFVHESVLKTMFTGAVKAETEISGRRAIIPTITGSAYLTGFNQLVLDSRDPLGEGFFIPAAGG